MMQTDVFFRAHTRLSGKPESNRGKTRKSNIPKWTPGLLLLDVRTTKEQALQFGTYAVCRLKKDGYKVTESGFFYSQDSSPRERKVIQRFGEGSIYRVLSQKEFTEETFLPLLREGVMIAGFEMPFRLSRLAVKINKSQKNRRAFSIYFKLFKRRNGEIRPDAFWPGIRVQNLGAGKSLYENLKVGCKDKRERKRKNAKRIRILDLQTLALSMTGEVYSLNGACQALGLPYSPEHRNTGRITKAECERAMRDLFRMLELLNLLRSEYDKHPISLLPNRALSPAGLAKGYYRAMGISAPFVPDKIHGIAAQSLAAGRAECCVRRVPVPVVYLDFHAQFSSVFGLLDCRELLTAERLSFPRWTRQARELARHVTQEDLLRPDFWKQLRFFALVEPENNFLPLRARYSSRNGADPTLAWQHATSAQPFWVTGLDIAVASLEGRPLKIIKAIKVSPHGTRSDLKSVQLYGQIPIDPMRDDLCEKAIELRSVLKKTSPALASGLKVLANGAAFGIWCEQNTKDLEEPSYLEVFSGETRFISAEPVDVWEEPGPFYTPLIASLVCGGSHLLLAMLEKMIREAGATIPWLFCDTDGAAVIANEDGTPVDCPGGPIWTDRYKGCAIPALSWRKLDDIRARFESLNLRKGTEFLKREPENFSEDGNTRRQLYGYAVANKRYCLYNLTDTGETIIRKPSGHGLGHLQPPFTVREWERRNKRKWTEDLHPFVYESWNYLLSREVGLPHKSPSWLSDPAAMAFPVSTPEQWERIGKRVQPFTTVLMPLTEPVTYYDENACENRESEISQSWITAYTDKLSRLYGAPLTSTENGSQAWLCRHKQNTSSAEVRAKIIGGELDRFLLMPELKFNAADGNTCRPMTAGLLRRKHVTVGEFRFIGKESSQRWMTGMDMGMVSSDESRGYDSTCREYRQVAASKPNTSEEAIRRDCGARARKYPVKTLVKLAKVSRDAVIRFRAGKQVQPSTFSVIQRALVELEILNEPPLPGTTEDIRLHPESEPLEPSLKLILREAAREVRQDVA